MFRSSISDWATRSPAVWDPRSFIEGFWHSFPINQDNGLLFNGYLMARRSRTDKEIQSQSWFNANLTLVRRWREREGMHTKMQSLSGIKPKLNIFHPVSKNQLILCSGFWARCCPNGQNLSTGLTNAINLSI